MGRRCGQCKERTIVSGFAGSVTYKNRKFPVLIKRKIIEAGNCYGRTKKRSSGDSVSRRMIIPYFPCLIIIIGKIIFIINFSCESLSECNIAQRDNNIMAIGIEHAGPTGLDVRMSIVISDETMAGNVLQGVAAG